MPDQEANLWLKKRLREGNWFDVSEEDDIPAEINWEFRSLLDMFRLFFAPEIRHRIHDGRLDQNFVLHCAQVVFFEETGKEVRLNEEVRGRATVQLDRPVVAGQEISMSDFHGLREFDLELKELDYGHVTIFWMGGSWGQFFDFSRGRNKVAANLNTASEFLSIATYATANGLNRAAIDALFSACEIVAKGILMLHPGRRSFDSHGGIHSALNRASKSGNVDRDFTRFYNAIAVLRHRARYTTEKVEPPSTDDLRLVTAQLESLQQRVDRLASTA